MTKYRYALVLYTYNQKDLVHRGARSVLAQACPSIDVLFSDDCSQDGTYEVLEAVAQSYDGPHRVSLNRNEKNLGVIEHVHRVFSLTDADVIINCAGDDICHSNRAARMIETFEREHPLLACSHAKVERADGSIVPRHYTKANFYNSTDPLKACDSMQLYLGATSAWHRDIIEKYGKIQFHDCFEDLVYGFRAALENRVAVINEDLLTYRLGGGVTNRAVYQESRDQLQVRRESELRRDIAALRQRKIDAETFGLDADHPIQRRIDRALRARQIRLNYIKKGAASLKLSLFSHPLQTLGQAASENRRWRKSLRRSKDPS
nr:glycosyltransferase [uncultured Roseovarius sp.]